MIGEIDIAHVFKRCGIRSDGYVARDVVVRRSYSYYWVAEGLIPHSVARKLYEHPIGSTDIRVNGNCTCPAPEGHQLTFRALDGSEVINDPDGKQEWEWDEYATKEGAIWEGFRTHKPVFSRDAFSIAEAFIDMYHIDSELGLYVFVQTIRENTSNG